MSLVGPGPELFRPALDGLVPYEPGKPVETVKRELGLERVVKLASNEGPFGPFPRRSTRSRERCPKGTATPTAAATRCARSSRSDTGLRSRRSWSRRGQTR